MSGAAFPEFAGKTEWLRGEGASVDVVMSSRVRLARNLKGFPFQTTADEAAQEAVLDVCRGRVRGSSLGARLDWLDLRELDVDRRALLSERHLISRQHEKGRVGGLGTDANRPRAVAVDTSSERLSIMVNEEDHLRIQAIRSGLDLEACFADADGADDAIEAGIDYAFSARYGYLTCCPTNVGTGARFSVMLHVPGLRLTQDLDKVKHAADDMGLAVRGFYGEGSEGAGDLYQLSNQTTLGKSERVLLHELGREIVPRIVDYERHARRELLTKRRAWLDDRIWRAYGTLAHARLLSGREAMELLSVVRLGLLLGVLGDGCGASLAAVHELMLVVQPAHLDRTVEAELDQAARRVVRATTVRDRLARGS